MLTVSLNITEVCRHSALCLLLSGTYNGCITSYLKAWIRCYSVSPLGCILPEVRQVPTSFIQSDQITEMQAQFWRETWPFLHVKHRPFLSANICCSAPWVHPAYVCCFRFLHPQSVLPSHFTGLYMLSYECSAPKTPSMRNKFTKSSIMKKSSTMKNQKAGTWDPWL